MVIATASNPQSPIENFSTFDFVNGAHKFSVRVTNLLGNTAVIDNTVTIANGTVSVGVPADMSPANGTLPICDFTVVINDGAGVGIESVTLSGGIVATNLPGTSSLRLSVRRRESACSTESITATDNLGNSDTRSFDVRILTNPRSTAFSCSLGC